MSTAPLIQGVNAAFLGVTDPQPHIDFYCGHLGYEVAETGVIGAAAASALWGDDVGETPVTVLTAAGASDGRIVLLTVAGAALADHPHSADFGLGGMDMYTRDIETSYRDLTAAGHPWMTPPATWKVPLGEQMVTVTEGLCLAPEGTGLVFVEPASPRGTAAWDADPDRTYTELTSVVCHVPDFDAEVAFWGPDGLGLGIWYDVSFSSEGLEEMAGLPKGTTMRLAFLGGPRTARLEITRIENRSTGIDRRDQQRTGRALGHSGWLVVTHDLDAALARVTERGGVVLCGPIEAPEALFGSGRVATVDTPNKILITIHEVAQMTRTPLQTTSHMLDSLRDRDLDGVLDCFDPSDDTYVYLEGPRWTNKGGDRIRQGWRDYFKAPIVLHSWRWKEGPEVHQSGDLALVAGVIENQFEANGVPRPIVMRMTWVLRRAEGVWRILHEHGSQPLPDPYGTGDWLVPTAQNGTATPEMTL